MHHPPPHKTSQPTGSLISKLRRQSPNCGYAEVQVIAHPGSHHREGDVILMDWNEYMKGAIVKSAKSQAVPVEPPPPTMEKPRDPRSKGKSKDKKAAR